MFMIMAQEIEREFHLARDRGGNLYRYDQGHYLPGAEEYLRDWIKHYCSVLSGRMKRWTPSLVDRTIGWVRSGQPYLLETPPSDRICLLDGNILWLDGRRTSPWNPQDWCSTVQIPISYSPQASSGVWDKFLHEILPQDAVDCAYELLGSFLVPDTDLQKFIWCKGFGSNGKSTFFEAVRRFVGANNVSYVPIDHLNDRFVAIGLMGKLLNLDPDANMQVMKNTSILKKLTGGDEIWCDQKGRDQVVFKPFCKLMISANNLPESWDKTEGFYSKTVLIPFMKDFDRSGGVGIEQQSRLVEDLAKPQNLSGALNRALDGLERLRLRGRLPEVFSIQEATNEFRELTDPVFQFAWNFAKGCAPGAVVLAAEVFREFEAWADMNGYKGKRTKGDLEAWLRRNSRGAFVFYRPDLPDGVSGPRMWKIYPDRVPSAAVQ